MAAKSGGVLEKHCGLVAFSTRTFHVKRFQIGANILLIVLRLMVALNCRDFRGSVLLSA